MEFWGVEVKAGETLKVSPGDGKLIHISQASIGDLKKAKGENIPVSVKIDEQKLVIGTLSADKFPQIQYDVVFEKDFELSHNGKNGSVFFCGYKTQNHMEDEVSFSDESDESDSDSEDELPLGNGIPTAALASSANSTPGAKAVKIEDAKDVKVEDAKAVKTFMKSKGAKAVKVEDAKAVKTEDAKDDSDEDSSDEDDSDDEDAKAVKVEDVKADIDEDSSDEDDSDDEDSDDSDDDEMDADDSDDIDGSYEEEEEKAPTPKKDEKKRPSKTTTAQVSAKKAKLVTPQKTAVKNPATAAAVHIATPHPGKQVGKTPKNANSKTPPASVGKSHSNAKRGGK